MSEKAVVLVHPTCGPTQQDDIPGAVRFQTYERLAAEVDNPRIRWAYLPYAMHMAGPREALQHMIIRRNYGCTHFIIGRDMAGCKSSLSGDDFYGPYDAQNFAKECAPELTMETVPSLNLVYTEEEGYVTAEHAEARGLHVKKLSGTQFRKMLREGKLDDREVEVDLNDKSGSGMPTRDIPGMPGGQMGMINIGEMLGGLGQRKVKRKLKVNEAYEHLVEEEADNLIDQEDLTRTAIQRVENDGIVFLDEIDKIAVNSEVRGGSVSREGVQRDLLPLIEGTTVTTKYGPVKTDHVLFICSGAFHLSKPSDLLPELQGRMPIRVELSPLTRDDLKRILVEPENSLIKQYVALLATEGVTLDFDDGSIDALADLSAEINQTVENIGARRLATVMERLLEEISFSAPDRGGETIQITEDKVRSEVGELAKDADLSRFIL